MDLGNRIPARVEQTIYAGMVAPRRQGRRHGRQDRGRRALGHGSPTLVQQTIDHANLTGVTGQPAHNQSHALQWGTDHSDVTAADTPNDGDRGDLDNASGSGSRRPRRQARSRSTA